MCSGIDRYEAYDNSCSCKSWSSTSYRSSPYVQSNRITINLIQNYLKKLFLNICFAFQIVRLCKAARAISNDPLRHDILSILDSAILPALSYMDCNCCMAEEVYSLLKLYAYQYRYKVLVYRRID